MKRTKLLFPLLCLILTNPLLSQKPNKKIDRILIQTGQETAPDKRIVIYEPKARKKGKRVILEGIISDQTSATRLCHRLDSCGYRVVNRLRILPDTVIGDSCFGIVSLSVMNMRSQPTYSAEMVSQALLGTPVKILDRKGWLRIQTPDGYIGYVTPGSIQPLTGAQMAAHFGQQLVIYTGFHGFVYQSPDKSGFPVSDITFGAILPSSGEEGEFVRVNFPDGRHGFLEKNACDLFESWIAQNKPDAENLIGSAFHLTGIPYLWGGTSTKGMDCSGFIKTIAMMNGLILSRDASQQAYEGIRIEPDEDYVNLQPGDLLFFGRKESNGKPEKVIHVGMYLGNKQFIHAATRIRVNSFDPKNEAYDAYNTNRFLWATRMTGSIGMKGITPIGENPFYQPQYYQNP